MATNREKLESLQKRSKRLRIPNQEDSVLNVATDVFENQEGQSDDDAHSENSDDENQRPIQFQRGETIRGSLCLWYHGKEPYEKFEITFSFKVFGI